VREISEDRQVTASCMISGFTCDMNAVFILLGCCKVLNSSSVLMFQDIALVTLSYMNLTVPGQVGVWLYRDVWILLGSR
jgi:hypothetical protein